MPYIGEVDGIVRAFGAYLIIEWTVENITGNELLSGPGTTIMLGSNRKINYSPVLKIWVLGLGPSHNKTGVGKK